MERNFTLRSDDTSGTRVRRNSNRKMILVLGGLCLFVPLACADDPAFFEGEEYVEPPTESVPEASTPRASADAARDAPVVDVDTAPPPPCRSGMHPNACAILASVGFNAVITQTLQTTSASGVTHLQDGTDPVPYTIGADFRTVDRDAAGKRKELEDLRNAGFVAWIRIPGRDGWGASSAEHIHSMFPGAKMKANKVYQVTDYLANKDGLAYHKPYTYAVPTTEQKLKVIRLFNSVNTPALSESLANQ